ncbi:MAG: polyamine aminopropyltransferase [Nitrospirae bacterium]|nr:polyamine aminopropyltransferase [Nitrospirota bacterium]
MLGSRWFLEITTDKEANLHSLEEVIYTGQSRFQRVEILRIGSYGKALVLDGKIQSAEADEFIYHEALVHLPLLTHGLPRRVLIAGGGEGATIREVLKYPEVEKVYMVDLDDEVVKVCKEYLPEWHRGCFDDPRVEVVFDDARKFIDESNELFDAIILDLPEPMEAGPAIMLYTKEFYASVKEHLKDDGVMVTQATSISVNNYDAFRIIHNTISQVFPIVRGYWTSVPSFYIPWGFVFASKDRDPKALTIEEIQTRLANLKDGMRFYNPEIHHGMLALPEFLKRAVNEETRVNLDDSPISFY